MARVTLIVDKQEPDELAACEKWFQTWADSITFRSQNEGCGCCVDIWQVEATNEAILNLPPAIVGAEAEMHRISKNLPPH